MHFAFANAFGCMILNASLQGESVIQPSVPTPSLGDEEVVCFSVAAER